jgi:hypothetical protein
MTLNFKGIVRHAKRKAGSGRGLRPNHIAPGNGIRKMQLAGRQVAGPADAMMGIAPDDGVEDPIGDAVQCRTGAVVEVSVSVRDS